MCTIFFGLAFFGGVFLHTGEKLVTRSAVTDVLGTDVDALFHVSVSDLSVQNHTDCVFGDIVDNTSLAVVDLVR